MKREIKFMIYVKRITAIGLIIGLLPLIASFFVSGVISNHLLSFGVGIFASSIMIFGTSLFMSLMQNITETSQKPTSNDTLHTYQV